MKMTNHEKILELSKIWYALISGDHHKDCDCHFRINTHYMYGDKVEWEVEHHGYILRDVGVESFGTREDAENYLIQMVLKKGIINEINWFLNPPDDCITYNHECLTDDELEVYKRRVLELVPNTKDEDELEDY
jgi:hypothetical protein